MLHVACCMSLLFLLPGCIHRSLTIQTTPPGAKVYVNDELKGESPVTYDFTWYGWYRLTLRRDGFERMDDRKFLRAPVYLWIPFDFFAEVLWPGWIHDARAQHYVLEAAEQASAEEVIKRAEDAREQALNLQK